MMVPVLVDMLHHRLTVVASGGCSARVFLCPCNRTMQDRNRSRNYTGHDYQFHWAFLPKVHEGKAIEQFDPSVVRTCMILLWTEKIVTRCVECVDFVI